MKMIVAVALALAAVVAAAPVEEPAKIIRSNYEQQPDGSFVSSYETENGIKHQVTGELKQVVDEDNKPQIVLVLRGSYEYTNKDGSVETVSYVADETGYHPEGPSIPVAPAARR